MADNQPVKDQDHRQEGRVRKSVGEDIQVSDMKLRRAINWIQNSKGSNIGGKMVKCKKMKSVQDQ